MKRRDKKIVRAAKLAKIPKAKRCRFCNGSGAQYKVIAGVVKYDGNCTWCRGTGVMHDTLTGYPKLEGFKKPIVDFLGKGR